MSWKLLLEILYVRYSLYKGSYYKLRIEHTWYGSAFVQNCIIFRSPSITEHKLRSYEVITIILKGLNCVPKRAASNRIAYRLADYLKHR